MNEEGLLLIATGARHRQEACGVVENCRHHLNGRPVALITDAPSAVPDGLFDQVLSHPDPHHSYRDKIQPLIHKRSQPREQLILHHRLTDTHATQCPAVKRSSKRQLSLNKWQYLRLDHRAQLPRRPG